MLLKEAYINTFGMVVTIPGKNMKSNSIPTIARMNGIEAFAPSIKGTSPILDAIKRQEPTGGVTNPIARETTVRIPKNNGSMPSSRING